MSSRTVIDGNAFYEIDEECLEKRQKENWKKGEDRKGYTQAGMNIQEGGCLTGRCGDRIVENADKHWEM